MFQSKSGWSSLAGGEVWYVLAKTISWIHLQSAGFFVHCLVQFNRRTHGIENRLHRCTVAFNTSILCIWVFYSILIGFVFTDDGGQISNLLFHFIFVCPVNAPNASWNSFRICVRGSSSGTEIPTSLLTGIGFNSPFSLSSWIRMVSCATAR